MNDSHRYMEYAQDIVYNGISWQPHNRWYLGFVLFFSIFVKLGTPLIWVVVSQTFLSLFSITVFSFSVGKIYGKNSGYILAFLLISWGKISEWNYYILTESLYISGVMLLSAFLILCRRKYVLWGAIGVIVFFFLRPTAVLFLGTLVITCLWMVKNKMTSFQQLLGAFVGIVVSCFVLNKMLESFIIVEAMERREAIFAYSTNPNFPLWDWVVFDVDKKLAYPKESYSQVTKMFLFVLYNPIFFLKLSLAKLFYFYGHVKPYFSWKHNMLVIGVLWPMYYFMIRGMKYLKPVHKVFLISYLVLNGLMIVMCSADWDGRFLIPVLPVIFAVSSVGLHNTRFKKELQ